MSKKTKTSPSSSPAKMTAGIQLQELRLDVLHVDHDTYQRQQLDRHVAKIVDNWDMELFTPPSVVHRVDGTYWITDGQQRIAAARQLGFTHVWAAVVHAKDIKHESRIFTQLNISPKKLDSRDIYKANLVWGEQLACATEEVLKRYGLTGRHVSKAKEVGAVTTLREAWGQNIPIGSELTKKQLATGTEVLDWVISVGMGLIDKGERPSHVFNKTNLGALIWIRRNANPVPDAEKVRHELAQTTAKYLQETITGITGSAGGNRRDLWGTRLARWINERSHKDVVELSDERWEVLA